MKLEYDIKEVYNTYQQLGSFRETGKVYGISRDTARRAVKKYHDTYSLMADECAMNGVPTSMVKHYWLKTENASVFVKNNFELDYDQIKSNMIDYLSNYSPKAETFKKYNRSDHKEHLLVIDPADVHINKMSDPDETGFEYNTEIAMQRVINGVAGILANARQYGICSIVLIAGNDILHTDNPFKKTTAGTAQDTYQSWWKAFEKARELYETIIEMCKEEADVNIVYCPSNHDEVLGFGVVDSIASLYRNDPHVTVSNYGKSARHRKYIRFGSNLIGVTHGDKAKEKDLSKIMQYEARKDWADTKNSYWYVHHLHHKIRKINDELIEKDHLGVTIIGNQSIKSNADQNTEVEYIRSPSSADKWHSDYGYINDTAIEAFVHHYTKGQILRITEYC